VSPLTKPHNDPQPSRPIPVELDAEFELWGEGPLPEFRLLSHRLLKEPIPFMPGEEATVNGVLNERRAELRRLEDASDFEGTVRLHHHDHWTEALLAYRDHLQPATYWQLAGEFYCDHSAPSAWFGSGWEEILSDERPGREMLMDADERAEFRNLPDIVKVMRGFAQEDGEHGFSWTRSEQTAIHFARKAASYPGGGDPCLAYGTVPREHVIAVLMRRDEDEILVRPENVSIGRITPIQ
jgi:hypothetical protein